MTESAELTMAKHEDLTDILACIEEAYEKYKVRIGKKPVPMLKDYNELIGSGSVYVLKFENSLAGVLVLLDRENMFYWIRLLLRQDFEADHWKNSSSISPKSTPGKKDNVR